ncbi:MAG: chemotaxis protein CheB [Chitinophagaceae bacterium]|nr:MAG: chemotaxis protein CheB [Chitinophagaceae bacterium]
MAQDLVNRNIGLVVIGGSAGSLDVVLKILPLLKPGANFTVIIVMHRKNTYDFSLSELLGAKTQWQVLEAEEKQVLAPGHVYLAPADYHLLIENDYSLSLDVSEKVHYSRPSIDVTFESAAEIFGPKLAAVLLSGANEDGVDGLIKVQSLGGVTIVQDPSTAGVAFMPQQAVNRMNVDIIAKPEEIAVIVSEINGNL